MSNDPALRHTTSTDGTRIGYLEQGRGPGVVLVQGAMADVHAFRRLATELSPSCTVYSAERRGRGLSPKPFDTGHDLGRDVEDIDAILAVTGADAVFGLSSGAVITLEAARRLERVKIAAVYEPPFYADGIDLDGIRRLNRSIERGDWPTALIESLLTAGTAPPILRALPPTAAHGVAAAVLALDAVGRQVSGRAGASLRELLPGVRYDFHDVAQVDGMINTFAAVCQPVLLLSGTRSPAFLQQAVRTLLEVLPHGHHVELPGLGHDGPWNSGGPKPTATALAGFLGRHRRSGCP